ncbi:MAG: type II toxin-antitoxin system RelB/DinJ family antitoxin [Clostridia bacterium]|nr:type II toxin-antitoxin system RelB/DinJ family antitoxin [Clostridia bacterium]
MQKSAGKTATLNVRIDPTVKSQSERVLSQLGIPMSTAIEMYLRQVVIRNGLPFLPSLSGMPSGLRMDALTAEELSAQFDEGYREYQAGDAVSVSDFRKEVASWTNA